MTVGFTLVGVASAPGLFHHDPVPPGTQQDLDTLVHGEDYVEGDGYRFEAYEQVVEGHTTYAVLVPGERVERPEPEDMEKTVQCVESQPVPTFPPGSVREDCFAHFGPIDPDPEDRVTDRWIDSVTATIHVKALGEADKIRDQGLLGWAVSKVPFL